MTKTGGDSNSTLEIEPIIVGARLRLARQEKELTQQELSDLTGIPKRTLENWEAGEHMPRGERLQQLADELDCSVAWILTGTRATSDVLYHLVSRVDDLYELVGELAQSIATYAQLQEERGAALGEVLARRLPPERPTPDQTADEQ